MEKHAMTPGEAENRLLDIWKRSGFNKDDYLNVIQVARWMVAEIGSLRKQVKSLEEDLERRAKKQ